MALSHWLMIRHVTARRALIGCELAEAPVPWCEKVLENSYIVAKVYLLLLRAYEVNTAGVTD